MLAARLFMPVTTLAVSLLLSLGVAGDHAGQKKPRLKQMTVPAGTTLNVQLRNALRSDGSRTAEQVTGQLVFALSSSGSEVVPAGASVQGTVFAVSPADRSTPGRIALEFHVIEHPQTGSRATIRTTAVTFEGERIRKKRRFGVDAIQLTEARVDRGTMITCSLLAPLVVFIPER